MAIEKRAFVFQKILESRLHIEFNQEEYINGLKYDKQKFGLVKMKISALDEKIAASIAYNHLDLFFRYYKFLGDKKDDWLFNTGEVVDEYGAVSVVDLQPQGFHFSTQIGDQETGNLSEVLITALLNNAPNSFPIIDRAVDIHNIAIADKNLKNGFLNLWSILEILFVSDQDEAKINELQKKVVPILQKDYIQIIFEELNKYLEDYITKDELEKLHQKVGEPNNDKWICFLTMLPRYNDLRQEVYDLLTDFPLIRSRISQLSNIYSKKENILSDISRYTKRIKWHFIRLYRTRNAIIHAGETPDNLKELGEHLHSYVDECLLEISILLAKDASLRIIDNVVIEVQLNTELMLNRLNKKGEIDESDIHFLFVNGNT